jgi:uncharacterized protein (TIGR01777 family)
VIDLKIAISGGSGFIGSHLIKHFHDQKDEVINISRSKQRSLDGVRCVTWDQLNQESEPVEHLDAWINLAGESINQRWTQAAKDRIMQSRVSSVKQMVEIVSKLENIPKVIISGSAMGIYGTSETETFTEQSATSPTDFLSSVVDQWEKATELFNGSRVVKFRIGLVLAMDGGALPRMMLPYRFGVGGRVGKGNQWISWIHMEDIVRMIEFCVNNSAISGAVNATAPHPVTMDQFGKTIGKLLRRPHVFPVPSFVMKLVFGEMSTIVLEGQRVVPEVMLDHGFKFEFAHLEEALRQCRTTNK